MGDNENNKKLLTYFKDLLSDLVTNNKYKQTHENLSDMLELLMVQDDFVSNLNDRIGLINLEPQVKKSLLQIMGRIAECKSSLNSQKVFITRLFVSRLDLAKGTESGSIMEEFEQGLNKRGSSIQEAVLVAYYRNNFYVLNEFIKQREFVLEKSNLSTAPVLDLSEYNRIIIQPFDYFETRLSSQDYSLVLNRKYGESFRKQNKLLDMRNLNYEKIKRLKESISEGYKDLIGFKYKVNEFNEEKQKQVYELHCLLRNKLQSLTDYWHTQSSYRIGLICSPSNAIPKKQSRPNYFIYEKFQIFESSKSDSSFKILLKQPSSFDLKNNPNSAIDQIRLVKQLFLFNMIYKRNQPTVLRINNFQQKLQSDFYVHLKEKQSMLQKERKKKLDKIKDTDSLRNYQDQTIRSFFLNWNSKIKQQATNKIPILCISLSDIYLITQFKYTRLKCEFSISYLDKRNRAIQSPVQTKYYAFSFDQNTQDWNAKFSPQEQGNTRYTKDSKRKAPMNILFDLTGVNDFLNLQVKITPQSKNSTIGGLCVISKRQKLRGFGENEELVLYEESQNSSERTVGFLSLFYLIKEHYDLSQVQNFKIQDYRKIKVLQKIGKIPPNYYQPTFIDFNPNKIPFYSQLLGPKHKNISRNHFEQTYLALISFLQNERIEQRRQQIISDQSIDTSKSFIGKKSSKLSLATKEKPLELTSGQSHFFSYERVGKYEKFLRIRLSKQLKNEFNPNFVYFFDHTGRISKKSRSQYQKELKASKIMNQSKNNKQSESSIKIQQARERDLINQFVYFEIPSDFDRISLKTSFLLSQSLKASMYQAQTLLVPSPHIQTLSILSIIFSLNEFNVQQNLVSIFIAMEQEGDSSIKNALEKRERKKRIEIEKTSKKIGTMQAFNPYLVPLTNRIVTLLKQQRSQINQKKSVLSQSISGETMNEAIDQTRVAQFTINFLSSMYPYFHPKCLQKQSLYIRYFVQKYLPQLNFNLNRKHIGLENFISKYLLSLFTVDLEEEITFHIWDFLVQCSNKFAGRINCMLTLLIFMEKTDFNPVIPLNSFVSALKENYIKFDLSNNSKKVADLMSESLGQFYEKQHQRKSSLYELRDQKGNLLLGYEFFKKIMFDTERGNRVNYIGNKRVNLNDLRYKLPEPKYHGDAVQEVKVLMRSFFISETVSISGWSLVVRWHNTSSSKIIVSQKSQILNEFIKLEYPKYLKDGSYDLPHLEFIIAPEREEGRFFVGYLPIIHLHKDQVCCEQVRLIYVKGKQVQLTNKGENVLNVQLILKSGELISKSGQLRGERRQGVSESPYVSRRSNLSGINTIHGQKYEATVNTVNLKMQKQYYLNEQKRREKIYDTLLDYSLIEEENDAIKEMKNIKVLFHKMKNPIDQFSQQKQHQLKVPFLSDDTFPQVLMNSQLLIEHFQALVYESFPDDECFKAHLPQLYKIFSKQTNFQMVFLTQILIEALLLDKRISFQQKIEYLYCLGKHYQNCGGTGLTVQTVDFLFEYIFKTYGWLSGVPYCKDNKGEVIKGVIFTQGVKSQEDVLEITSILQDWVHICKIKFGHLGLVLGDAFNLNELRSLLPLQTLQMLHQQNSKGQVRIQITYLKNNSQYMWSANVALKNFKVIQMGTKFLERYPPRQQLHAGKVVKHHMNCKSLSKVSWNIKDCPAQCRESQFQLDTSSEILYNCSNFISLQSSCTLDRSAFRKAIYSTPLLSYLLHYSSLYEPILLKQSTTSIPRPKTIENPEKTILQYPDWILYRYQNCIAQWRRCYVERIQDSTGYVRFPQESGRVERQVQSMIAQRYGVKMGRGLLCKGPLFEVWQMDENLLDGEGGEQVDSLNEMRKRNQKESMRTISAQYQTRKV